MSAVLGVALGTTAALAQNNTYPWPQSGNIGIGTTSPAYPLDVVGQVHISGGSAGFSFADRSGSGNHWEWYGYNGMARLWNSGGLGDILRVRSTDGYVGIGTTPAHRLDVAGKVHIAGTGCGFSFADRSGSGNHWEWYGNNGVARLWNNGGQGDVLALQSANGYVGIGTTTPSFRLDVAGTVRTQGPEGGFCFTGSTNTWAWYAASGYGGLWNTGTASNTLVIRDNGNVGVGTDPQTRLDVAGMTRTMCLQITGGCDLAEPFEVSSGQRSAISGQIEAHPIEPGLVVVIDPDHAGQLKLACEPYDRKVAGVISGANGLNPGMVLTAAGNPATRPAEDARLSAFSGQQSALGGQRSADGRANQEPETGNQKPATAVSSHPVALTGRVWCFCDAGYGAIAPGDRLTTSATAGHAMKAADPDLAGGAVLGKAMSELKAGKGLVLVLIQPQ